jgi:hypothetical protein
LIKAKGKRQKAKERNNAPSRCRFAASSRRSFVALLHHRVAASLLSFAFCLLPFAFTEGVRAQKIIDQILTLVNEDIITRTDLIWGLALDPNAPSPAGEVSADLLRRALEVRIDQLLILQEARRLPAPEIRGEEVRAKVTALSKRFPSEAAFRERIESVGLTQQRLNELMREVIQIERYVDFRFRSFVFVTDADIQKYYDERLAPEMRKQGQVPPALDSKLQNGQTIHDNISEIIKQEKINQEIDTWLNSTRQRADIVQLVEL